MHTSGTGAAGCGTGPSRRSHGGGTPLKSRVFEIIAAEQARQNSTVELIASENFVYNASLLDAEVRLMEKYKSEELAKHYSTQLDQLYNEYVTRMKGK